MIIYASISNNNGLLVYFLQSAIRGGAAMAMGRSLPYAPGSSNSLFVFLIVLGSFSSMFY